MQAILPKKDIHQILKKYWGYDTFRPLQEDIIQSILKKNDTLALLPTGGGKSICFQVPGLAIEGLTIVVSPLIALMKDQVFQLKKKHIPTEAIYTGIAKEKIEEILNKAEKNEIKFLYLSPERLQSASFILRSQKFKVGLFAIDEAHCISQWGYDFRPNYLKIPTFIQNFPNVHVIALTATATSEVKKDIIEKLQLKNCSTFQKSFERKNLTYVVIKSEDKLARLVRVLKKIEGSAIIYTNSRNKTKEIARFLQEKNLNTTYYNAGLSPEERNERQDKWISNECRIIVATNAFGMGIDKPDVRLVVHMDLPSSLEAYYQEAGRAGRDEKQSYAITFSNAGDIEELKRTFFLMNPSIKKIKTSYQKLKNYYKLAEGTSTNKKYPFEISDFSQFAKLSNYEIKIVSEILIQYNIIAISENFFEKSSLKIEMSPAILNSLQKTDSKVDSTLRAVLRIYGGKVIHNTINIDEKKIAFVAKLKEQDVVNTLNYLSNLKNLSYKKAQNNDVEIFFPEYVYKEDEIPIDFKEFINRKKVLEAKMEATINYVTHEKRCRSQILLDYFDETKDTSCGKCDFCIKENSTIQNTHKKYYEEIKRKIKESPKTIVDLVDEFNITEAQNILSLLSHMLDNDEITTQNDVISLV